MISNVFIIAEMSANHNQKLDIALKTIKAAKESGADAVKLQTYTPDTMTINCNNDYFLLKHGTPWDGQTLYELYGKAYTPWDWHKELFGFASSLDIKIFSTPFDKTSVDFLEKLGNPIYKIASFEITDIPLIEYVASKSKPMIISTGIASLEEINNAIDACRTAGNNDITLLKCTSSYPASLKESNLLTIPDMINRFDVKIGLSDHTIGAIAATTAVALGAKVIEKHFILDKNLGGPDAIFSAEPDEFKFMTEQIRMTELSLGEISYTLSENTKNNRKFARSLFVVKDIIKGEFFSENNIRSIRPGDGLPPKYLYNYIGKQAQRNYKKGEPFLG